MPILLISFWTKFFAPSIWIPNAAPVLNDYLKVIWQNTTFSARGGLLLDSDHVDALKKIKYLESKHQRTAEEELNIAEAPQFGHGLKDLK